MIKSCKLDLEIYKLYKNRVPSIKDYKLGVTLTDTLVQYNFYKDADPYIVFSAKVFLHMLQCILAITKMSRAFISAFYKKLLQV